MAKDATSDAQHPFNRTCQDWLRLIEVAKKKKQRVFGQYAEEAARFYDGPNDWMWKEEYATGMQGYLDKGGNSHLPTFRIQVNKVFEAVALFGPALLHRYPQVNVTPVDPPQIPPETLGIDVQDPASQEAYLQYLQGEQLNAIDRQSTAQIAQHYLNWLQVEANKKDQARRAITDAIVKGMGILWIEMFQPRGSNIRYPRARYVSVDDLQQDPDAEYSEDVMWIARRRRVPVNLVARMRDIPEEELIGSMQSLQSQTTVRGRRDARGNKTNESGSYDILEYWEIYSKNGFGHRLKKTRDKANQRPEMDWLGDFVYLEVAKDIPYPLNYPSWALEESEEEQFERAQWPVPYWTDEGLSNGWPFVPLTFYEKLNCVWPLSLITPAIGELRFVNWCMSFLADKAAAASTNYIGVVKAAGMDIQEQLQGGLAPFTVIEISDLLGKSIKDVISFIESPSFSLDVWKMVSEVMQLIDKRTGLTELIYGLTGNQIRSATEANIREGNTSIRPDDMAERTEDFYSRTSLKEFEAAVWSLEAADVVNVLGEAGAAVFEEKIQGAEFESIVRNYNYRVQAGSARKPNKANRLQSLNEFGQIALPVLQQFAAQGIVDPWNNYASQVAQAMDLEADAFLIQLPPPEEQGPSEEEVKVAEQAQELEHKEELHDQEMSHEEEKNEEQLDFLAASNRLKLAAASKGPNGSR
jgi:hypothetical protein